MQWPAQRLQAEVLRLPWRILLSEPVVATTEVQASPPPAILATIALLGTWSGWLTLRCDVRIAQEIAARMRSAEVVSSGDLDEAARWLVTVIAQAIHPIIDPSARLGTPSVLDGTAPWAPPSCRMAARLRLRSGERAMAITLSERMPVAVRRTGAIAPAQPDGEGHAVED